jgi:hypothetical protein
VNQDFAMLATSAMARRLLLLQPLCQLTLPEAITQLAAQNRLADNAFDPYDSTRHVISQFLLDCNLRGVIQADYHPEMTPLAVLNVVRISQPTQIVIVSERRRVWANAGIALSLIIKIVTSVSALEDIDYHAVVIYDTNYSSTMSVSGALQNVVRDFPHIIVFDDRRGFDRLMHWTLWARLLFATMPHPLYPRRTADVPIIWKDHPLVDFAVFYNVCIFPNLITDPTIMIALRDSYAESRLEQQSSLLTLT